MPFTARLKTLSDEGLIRYRRVVQSPQTASLIIDGKSYLAFSSNDYLGLANHPSVIAAAQSSAARYGVGSGASHLICGCKEPNQVLEQKLATFVGLPRALYFSTGYTAAVGIIPALVGIDDAIFSDSLNHACLIDGMRLSKAAIHIYPHFDIATLEKLLANSESKVKLVISDTIFSMDGDIAPLRELLMLCERYNAWLLVDDAHGFGVVGENGRGCLSHFDISSPKLLYMATLGKAAGVFGAFIAGDTEVIEWLLQRTRTYIFTTAPPPMLASATIESLQLIEKEEWRRMHLRELINLIRTELANLPWRLLPSITPIQPLIVGDNHKTMELTEALMQRGIWVPAIRPPTVPQNTARLRISLSAAHSKEEVYQLIIALKELATQTSSTL